MSENPDRTRASNCDEIRQLLESLSNHEPALNPFSSVGGAPPGHDNLSSPITTHHRPHPFRATLILLLLGLLLGSLWSLACGSNELALSETIVVAQQVCIEAEGCVFDEKRIIQNRLISHTNRSEEGQSVSIKVANQGECRFTVKWQILGDPMLRDFVVVAAGESDLATAQIPPGRRAIFFWSCFSLEGTECRGEVDIRIARPGDSTS